MAVSGTALASPSLRSADPTATAAVPPYYVALTFTGNGNCCRPGQLTSPATDAVVKATATGHALATVAAPKPDGTFVLVSGAANDRTFVLAAQRLAVISKLHGQPPLVTQFYLLRIHPNGKTVTTQLTKLPFRTSSAVMDTDMNLSPDGSALAVNMFPFDSTTFNSGILRIYQTATGTGKTWHPGYLGTDTLDQSGSSLWWEANGRTLGFIRNGFRLLDTAGAGDNLLTDSRLAVPAPALTPPYWRQALVTPDGSTALEVLQINKPGSFTQQLDAFSTRTGKLERVLNHPGSSAGEPYEQVQWSSASGNVLLISGARSGTPLPHAAFYMSAVGVLAGSTYTPLPWSSKTFMAAW
jgi:hypothetical protein